MRQRKSLFTIRGLKKFLATYLATGDLRRAYLLNSEQRKLVSLKIPGAPGEFRIRTGTSDAVFLREAVLTDFNFREYRIPPAIHPRTILDIGANTGIVSIALKRAYPDAHLFAFEPWPENYALLKHNVRHLENVFALPVGLGKETTELEYFASDDSRNLGGGSFYPIPSQVHLSRGKLPIMSPREALSKYDIRDIDLIKIDTEGAEHDILTSFPVDVISQVSAIVGELHGIEDQELISYLLRWFDIEQTNVKGRLSLFKAINKQCGASP